MFDLVYPSDPAPRYPRPSVDHPGPQPPVQGEMLPLVHPDGQVYGQATREWCHGGSHALHPVVHLHIIDRDGNLYLQKRSMRKKRLPGYWDTAVGGHVSYGETLQEALYREAFEELGLEAFNPVCLGSYEWDTVRDRELVVIFAILGHPALTPDGIEVSEGRWWKPQELDQGMGQGLFTPNFEDEYKRIRPALLAMI